MKRTVGDRSYAFTELAKAGLQLCVVLAKSGLQLCVVLAKSGLQRCVVLAKADTCGPTRALVRTGLHYDQR